MANQQHPVMEFHVSRQSRDFYGFDQNLFSLDGNVLFANFYAARVFTQKINEKRDLLHFPEQTVRAGQINAMGLIDEILHYIYQVYRQELNPQAGEKALQFLVERHGSEGVDQVLKRFLDEFPPLAVYHGKVDTQDYLNGQSGGVDNRQLLIEEMVMLWLANKNPAAAPFGDLFDDRSLQSGTNYAQLIASLREFFTTQPPFGPDSQSLVEMFRAPALAVPYSLTGQLEFIRERWGSLLGKYMYRLLGSLDLIKEEEKAIFLGPGPIGIPQYKTGELDGESERFSPDREWMPSLVLIAKNSYVWLDQLRKKYKKDIYRLDQIPDEELDQLARWGITGLWLIGLWERSPASARIKQYTGNPEAVASAYSLAGYDIASDLGGYPAYESLRHKAWTRGIRLASDMVPNHMGIDSSWVINHPDWFISLDYSPFPSYTFNGPDLSPDGRASLYLEDHYFSRTDASVVFKRVDRTNGSEKFIYHGNDGTSMPWNDTAQLNYLMPEVREAVIQTILHVARMFPIIRFDAAMTLAKKHFQRLWFPEPGTGGAIPTRAEHGLTRQQFDAAIPEEFWREVVDRVAREVPDTLLLAEAFWLMESYFVRTLGMHRVYNSAFMHLLRNEENEKYRTILKNTIEYDPEIMKRFVNFMNNPDERTAVDQFGKGDKYFGICTLMATLPGLPMLGHGQVEGFTEKYGMEYRRAYYEEIPDPYLVQRHEREIFPLLQRRKLFAGVDNFLLYDFYTPEGGVNEDVYAYTNGIGEDHGLVVYHNRFASTHGWIRISAGIAIKTGPEKGILHRSLSEGLGITTADNSYAIFRDLPSGLEYIRATNELVEKGLYLELNAYKTYVFVEFRQVIDGADHRYGQLNEYLAGRGVPSIEEALHELFLRPVHEPFRQLANVGMFRWLRENQEAAAAGTTVHSNLLPEVNLKLQILLQAASDLSGGKNSITAIAAQTASELQAGLHIFTLEEWMPLPGARRYQAALQALKNYLPNNMVTSFTLFSWILVHNLGRVLSEKDNAGISRAWIDEWLLGRILDSVGIELGLTETESARAVEAVRVMTSGQAWFEPANKLNLVSLLAGWLKQEEFQRLLGVNRYRDIIWYNGEAFQRLLGWMLALAVVQIAGAPHTASADLVERIIACHEQVLHLEEAASRSGFKLEVLLENLAEPESAEENEVLPHSAKPQIPED